MSMYVTLLSSHGRVRTHIMVLHVYIVFFVQLLVLILSSKVKSAWRGEVGRVEFGHETLGDGRHLSEVSR